MHTRLLFIFLWVLSLNPSFAQAPDSVRVPYFSIVSPSSIARLMDANEGQYGQAQFGSSTQAGDVIAPVMVAADDVNGGPFCAANAQDFTGKIVLIPRGVCEFGLKALLAQQQGAVGILIHNFEEFTINMSAGGSGALVTIPVIMIPKSVGDDILISVLQGAQVMAAFTSGPYHFGRITGKLTGDLNDNCLFDSGEPGLKQWKITAEGQNNSFSTFSRADGSYLIYADSSNSPYTVKVTPYNFLWNACSNAVPVTINGTQDTVQVPLSANPIIECPLISVSIAAPILRRCFENWFYAEVCNTGTLAAADAYVDIQLDYPAFEPIQNADLPFTTLGNGLYRFELGNLAIGACIDFKFTAIVSCNDVELGQTLCYTAHAYPDTFCIPPGQNWNGANVTVLGTCANDLITFEITNAGVAPMSQSANYIVLRKGEMIENGLFQLSQGGTKSLIYPADGATWRVETTQEPNHPNSLNPSATLEACGTNSSISTGFALQFSVYDPSPAEDHDCQAVVGSWDPNDKQGFPLGATEAHLILPNTEIEYLIRFQNTGTDTAFNLVVRDTLAPQFEVGSVRPGIASAPYDFEVLEGNILVFSFKNIKLVDSFTNEPASHGFVRFKLNQKPDLAWGTHLNNAAAIYFDFNEPVITNISNHQIGAVPHATTSVMDNNASLLNALSIAPNPGFGFTELSVQPTLPDGTEWNLMNVEGKRIASGYLQESKIKMLQPQLNKGIYWIEFIHNGKKLGLAKWVAQ